MPPAAILLLFASAFLHTTWNLLLKQAGEKYIATWWGVLLGSALFLPFLFFTGLPAREIWPLLMASVLVEIAYYIILATAYRMSDFSLVYPLARGAAPGLIAVWSLSFLGEKLSTTGLAGLIVIILGLMVIAGANFFNRAKGEAPHWRGVGLALALALLISIYSTIDGAAVKRTAAFPYAVMVFFLAPALTAPLVFRVYGWPTLWTGLRAHAGRIISVGLLTVLAYLLALGAYGIAPVSYAGAVREVSVVLGALAGWLFLREGLGAWRLAGAIIVFTGILLIAFGG